MLTITPKKVGTKVFFTFSGTVDETFDPSTQIEEIPKEFGVECSLVNRINSTGVKKWIIYFSTLFQKGYKINFTAVSPALVEQVNLILNFLPRQAIESVTLPFTCRDCDENNYVVKSKTELAGVDLDKSRWACSACKKVNLEFDDVAEEYLSFWA